MEIIVKKQIWIPDEYVTRKEYLRLYQKNRYHSDGEFRQTQIQKVKNRYMKNKEFQNNIKEISIQTL
jgi:hypothetical protein